MTKHRDDLTRAFFADLIRAEAAGHLRAGPLTPAQEARYRRMRSVRTSWVTSVKVDDRGRVAVTARLDEVGTFTYVRSFDTVELLELLGQALEWAASKERDEWSHLPAVGE